MSNIFFTGIVFLFFIVIAIRLLRWLSIVQQKEYRFDRLLAFLKTKEGMTELIRIVPGNTDLNYYLLKRPRFTSRILFIISGVALLSIVQLFVLQPEISTLQSVFFQFVLLLLFVPLYVFFAVLPTSIISNLLTFYELQKASTLIKKHSPVIIGITGSYGKTATKHLLVHILRDKYSVFTTPRSHNTKYSVARSIASSYHGEKYVVLEYAAYTKNEIKELCRWFRPHNAVITGLTEQHLELFGSLENIALAKAELIKALPDDGTVYWYSDDKPVEKIVKKGVRRKTLNVYAVPKNAWIENIEIDKKVGSIAITYDQKRFETKFIGTQYTSAINLAVQTAVTTGQMVPKTALTRVAQFIPSDNFIRSYSLSSGARIIDDGGSANPKGTEAAISLLSKLDYSKKIMVFGGIVDLGDKSVNIHNALAHKAASVFFAILYTGMIGRDEFEKNNTRLVTQRELIVQSIQSADSDTVILLEGKMPGWLLTTIKKLRL